MEQSASILWYLLAIVLVGSALIGRQLPMGGLLRMALLWVAIFAGLLGLFKLAQGQGYLTGRWADQEIATPDEAPAPLPQSSTQGTSLRIPVAADGHYWVEGTINGSPARFLIDSGATFTALSLPEQQVVLRSWFTNDVAEIRGAISSLVVLLGMGYTTHPEVSPIMSAWHRCGYGR